MKQQQQQEHQNIGNTVKLQAIQHQAKFVLPGQSVEQTVLSYNNNVYQDSNGKLLPIYPGYTAIKRTKQKQVLNLLKFAIQYLPNKNDVVIGIIKVRTAETFIVDLSTPIDGHLGGLQFEGATKRNKPNLQVGDVVYARVVQYSKFVGAKLSCINKGFTNSKNPNQLGPLKGGSLLWLPVYKHGFLQPYLQKIGNCLKFQLALGKNGYVWVNSSNNENIMVVMNMLKILCSDNAQKDQIFTKMLTLIK